MKEIDEKQIKKIDVEIIKDIDRVCRENNIKYTLIGGSLIGAVRHKGFIPWDDDIDIALARDEYEKFIEIYNKNKNNNYEILSNKLDSSYYYQYSRVVDKRTKVEENVMLPINNLGVFIDVFPVDNISNRFMDLKLLIINFFVKAHAYKTTKVNRQNSLKELIKKILFRKDYQYYFDKIQKISQKENKKNCENAGVLVCGTGKKDIFPKHIFDEYVDLEFEGEKLMAVKEYETFLKHRFGDYMKLPPEEERVTHHNMKVFWKEGE